MQPQRTSEDTARLRRIETRLTQLMVAMGITAHAQQPEFERDGRVANLRARSRHTSIKELLDSVPETWEGPVNVFVGDDMVATIARPGNRS